MKKIRLSACLIVGFSLFVFSAALQTQAQQPYKVEVFLSGIHQPAKVFLEHYTTGTRVRIDSAMSADGHFVLTGELVEPTRATIRLRRDNQPFSFYEEDKLDLMIANGETVKVKGTDSISTAKVSGSALNKKYEEYLQRTKVPDEAIKAAQARIMKAPKELVEAYTKDAVNVSSEQAPIKEKIAIQFIKENPDSYVSVIVLKDAMGYVIEASKYDPVFNGLSERMRNSHLGKELKEKLDDTRKVALGAIAPDFSAPTPDSTIVHLSDYRGKYVLVDFWASWCHWCRAENPTVLKAYKDNANKNFVVVGCSLDARKADWIKAIKEDGMPWTQLCVGPVGQAISKLYDVRALPQNFLLDPSGKIVAKNLRGDELEKKLAEVLNK